LRAGCAIYRGAIKLLTEFDQTTIANMTAALDYICKRIPAYKDSNELRKRIADELMQCARTGRRTLIDLEAAGLEVLKDVTRPPKFSWFGLRR
jgi:hypothetical protein